MLNLPLVTSWPAYLLFCRHGCYVTYMINLLCCLQKKSRDSVKQNRVIFLLTCPWVRRTHFKTSKHLIYDLCLFGCFLNSLTFILLTTFHIWISHTPLCLGLRLAFFLSASHYLPSAKNTLASEHRELLPVISRHGTLYYVANCDTSSTDVTMRQRVSGLAVNGELLLN